MANCQLIDIQSSVSGEQNAKSSAKFLSSNRIPRCATIFFAVHDKYRMNDERDHRADMSHDYPLYFITAIISFQYTNEMMPDCFLAQKLPDW